MQPTGVYWIPLFQILETCGFEVCLVNARHVQNVPAVGPMSLTANGYSISMPWACFALLQASPKRMRVTIAVAPSATT
jgi:hypothetical protein